MLNGHWALSRLLALRMSGDRKGTKRWSGCTPLPKSPSDCSTGCLPSAEAHSSTLWQPYLPLSLPDRLLPDHRQPLKGIPSLAMFISIRPFFSPTEPSLGAELREFLYGHHIDTCTNQDKPCAVRTKVRISSRVSRRRIPLWATPKPYPRPHEI